jgi:hypothetical protein
MIRRYEPNSLTQINDPEMTSEPARRSPMSWTDLVCPRPPTKRPYRVFGFGSHRQHVVGGEIVRAIRFGFRAADV